MAERAEDDDQQVVEEDWSPGYLVALDELDAILGELEDPAVDIDRLAERVRRAAALIATCRARITAARLEVEQVVAELDGPLEI